MLQQGNGDLSEREAFLATHEREMADMQFAHAKAMKDKEITLAKLEAKWASWLSIPLRIIKLPVAILLGVAYIVSMFTKHEVEEDFWNWLR